MKIGFLLPAVIATAGAGNGVRVAAVRQAAALQRAGHEVAFLDPWNATASAVRGLDILHCYVGALGMHTIEHAVPDVTRHLVLQPIIDSNVPNWQYRLVAAAGNLHPKIYTVPGELRRQALSSRLIVVRSQLERQRVIRGLGIDPQRIAVEVVLHGIDPPEPADPQGIRRELDLPESFILHVSSYTQERKNVVRLIEAIGPTGLPLVICGSPGIGPTADRIAALAQRYPVRILGFQSAAALNSLYAACRVFCLPTLHEGVGLVALEAASYGAAIVVTQNGGPREYLGPLAVYVNPYKLGDIRRAVLKAWEAPRDGALARHMRTLSWDATTQALIRAYEKAAS